MIAMVFAFFFVVFFVRKIKFQATDGFYLLFILYNVINLVFSEHVVLGLRGVIGLLFSLVTLLVLKSLCLRSPERMSLFFDSLIKASFSFVILSLISYFIGFFLIDLNSNEKVVFFGLMLERGMPRLIGLAADPNFFVLHCSFIFFYLFYKERSRYENLMFSLVVLSLILTFSLGGATGIAIGILFGAVLRLQRVEKSLKSVGVLLLIFVSFLLAIILTGLSDTLLRVLYARLESLSDGSGRFILWQSAFSFLANDLVFGVGIFGYRGETGSFAHNTFIEVITESGLLGFTLYLGWILLIAAQAFPVLRRTPRMVFFIPLFASIFIQMNGISATINEVVFLNLAILQIFVSYARSDVGLPESRLR